MSSIAHDPADYGVAFAQVGLETFLNAVLKDVEHHYGRRDDDRF